MTDCSLKGIQVLKKKCPLIYKDIDSEPVLKAAKSMAPEWMCDVVEAAAYICEMSFQRYMEESIN